MRGRSDTWALGALFACACAMALMVFFRQPLPEDVSAGRHAFRLSLAWRAPFEKAPNTPCAVPNGWVVTDEAGGIALLASDGQVRWRVTCSNQTFACGASFASGRVFAAAESGDVFCFRCSDGARIWRVRLDAHFQHAPLVGDVAAVSAVWVMSQTDGQLFCLAVADGRRVWTGEPTNRCDGGPTFAHGMIAYGNCDGAVYVFDAANGKRKGTVPIGDSDQMAGEGLPVDPDSLVIGTRQGNLAVVRLDSLERGTVTNVSPSELFVRPAPADERGFAVGTNEGRVEFWNLSGETLTSRRTVELGSPVQTMVSRGENLFVLAGGALCAIGPDAEKVVRLSLGDDVKGLTLAPDGTMACVADGAVVCVKGERL